MTVPVFTDKLSIAVTRKDYGGPGLPSQSDPEHPCRCPHGFPIEPLDLHWIMMQRCPRAGVT